MESCPHCEGSVVRVRKEQARVVVGTCFLVRGAALACRKCRAVFLPGDGLERIDLEVASVLAVRAQPCGEAFRFLRRALALRALELATLLGVTAETVSRWENDQRAVDLNAWITVGSIVLERAGHPPATLRRLLALQKPRKLPRPRPLHPARPARRGSPAATPTSARRPKVA